MVTSNVKSGVRNSMAVVFGLLKMSFWVPKRSFMIFGKTKRPKVSGKRLKFP